jgi:hypothetical protein
VRLEAAELWDVGRLAGGTTMKRVVTAALAILLIASAQAEERGPSTPEERSTAVKLARLLENDPLGPQAKEARQWFTVWLVVVPDITVSLCGDLLGTVPRSAKKYSSEIVVQAAYSEAAFIIENPDKAKDELAVYQAGLEGCLKSYDAIRKTQPKISWPLLEDLERKGPEALHEYVVSAAKKCAK